MASKIVLINPPSRTVAEDWDVNNNPHLGLAYIAGALKKKKIDYSVLDCKCKRISIQQMIKQIKQISPNIAAITSMTHEIKYAAHIAKKIKQTLPNITIILGGNHVSALPIKTLKEFPVFDIGVIGEGELTFVEIIKTIDNSDNFRNIKGIVYKKNKKIIKTKSYFIQNLDSIPDPDYSKFPKSKGYCIITSRGCPYTCIFCSRFLGNKIRPRSVKRVVSEFEDIIRKYHPKLIRFEDETFTLNPKRLHKILDLIILKGLNKKVGWKAQTRPDIVNEELLKKMKKAGCSILYFGVESGNQNILNKIKKNIILKKAAKSIYLAKKIGLKTEAGFILGHPNETLKTANDSINFAIKLNPTFFNLGIMIPYPKTEIRELALKKKKKIVYVSNNWDDYNIQLGRSLSLKNLTIKKLKKLQLKGYLKFYLYNLRFLDLFKFIIHYRMAALAFINQYYSIKK